MNRIQLVTLSAPALLFAACVSTGVTDSTGLDGPVHGRPDETRFVVGTDDSAVGIGDLSRIAKTIRKYKNLGANEQDIIRRVAALKLDGLVAGQMQRLAPQFERKKAVVRQKSQARIAAVRQQGSSGRAPAASVEKEVAAARVEEARAIEQIDADWKSAARAEVARTYGSDFAIPVSNPDGKAVVAFASLRESSVSVSAAAYEVGGTSAQLAAATAARRQVSHEGKSYALLDAPVTLR